MCMVVFMQRLNVLGGQKTVSEATCYEGVSKSFEPQAFSPFR